MRNQIIHLIFILAPVSIKPSKPSKSNRKLLAAVLLTNKSPTKFCLASSFRVVKEFGAFGAAAGTADDFHDGFSGGDERKEIEEKSDIHFVINLSFFALL